MPTELQIIRAQEFIRVGAQGKVDFKASKEALAVLAALPPTKETKALADKIQARLKKARLT